MEPLGMKRTLIIGWVLLANAGCLADGGSPASPTVGESASANINTTASGSAMGNAGSGASAGSTAAGTSGLPGGSGAFANPGFGASTGTLAGIDAAAHNGVRDGGPSNAGLPCDVAQLLVTRCQLCHGSPPTPPSPMQLMTHADLMKPAIADPSKTYAQESVIRMQNATLPMPPAPYTPATAAEITILQDWINSGYPQGACGGPTGATDGGGATMDAAACVSPVPPIVDTPITCTSKMNWTGGNSAAMRPGESCAGCHGTSKFSIAGTVYPTVHEKDDCYGVSGARGVTVVITDKKGTSITLNPNNVGTFTYAGSLALPYQAKVMQGGKTRAMMTPQMEGDCNTCHSEPGYSCAPGRIMIP
jgi:hypothetical protein